MIQFYHAWADGAWELPLADHVEAMQDASFPAPLHVGLIGTAENRAAVRHWLRHNLPRKWTIAAQADRGFEEVTLMAARDWAMTHDGPVLYMHDKGAMNRNAYEADWRRRVTGDLVGRWRHCTELLDRFDAVGCHWLHPAQDWPRPWPSDGNPIRVSHPHFSGTFWWANASYLRTLPAWPFQPTHHEGCCGPDSVPQARGETTGRWLAELWIGMGNPNACDLYPGMPGEYTRNSRLTWSRA